MIKNTFMRWAYFYDHDLLLQAILDEDEIEVERLLSFEFIYSDKNLMLAAVRKATQKGSEVIINTLIPKVIRFQECTNDLVEYSIILNQIDLFEKILSAKDFSFEELWLIMRKRILTFSQPSIDFLLKKTCTNQNNCEKIMSALIADGRRSTVCDAFAHSFLQFPGVFDRFKDRALSLFNQAVDNRSESVACAILSEFFSNDRELNDIDKFMRQACKRESYMVVSELTRIYSSKCSNETALECIAFFLKNDSYDDDSDDNFDYEYIMNTLIISCKSINHFLVNRFFQMPDVIDKFKDRSVILLKQAMDNNNQDVAVAILDNFDMSGVHKHDIDALINIAYKNKCDLIFIELIEKYSAEYNQENALERIDFLRKIPCQNQINYEEIMSVLIADGPSSTIDPSIIHGFLRMPGVADIFKDRSISLFKQALDNKSQNLAVAILDHFDIGGYELGDLDALIYLAGDTDCIIIFNKLIESYHADPAQQPSLQSSGQKFKLNIL